MKKILFLSFVFILFSFVFSSCSPQKRLERLLKQYPELCITDTINITTPVPIPAKNAEFNVNYTYRDTLISLYSTDSMKLSYSVINDSIIKVFVHVPPKTMYVTQKVPVEKIIIQKPDNWGIFLKTLPYLILGLIVIAILSFIYKK